MNRAHVSTLIARVCACLTPSALQILPTLFALLMAMTSLTLLSGCGSTTSTTPIAAQAKTFVYVPNGVVDSGGALTGAGGITEFQMAATGTLTKLPGSPLTFNANVPTVLAADPLGRFLFAASPNNIITFSIIPSSGALTQVAMVALPPVPGTFFAGRPMLVDHAGNFLYAGTQSGLSVFSIASSGTLTNIQTVTSAGVCSFSNGLALDAAGKFLYVSACFQGSTVAFGVNSSTGMLTMVSSVPAVGPDGNSGGVAVTPAGNFVYVQSVSPPQNSIYASSNGMLTLLQTQNISTLDDFDGSTMLMHPSGKFLYETTTGVPVSLVAVSSLLGMSIAGNGGLTEISPFRGFLPSAPGIGIDPQGNFVLASQTPQTANGTLSTSLSVLAVDTNTGNLTQISGSPFALDVPSSVPGAPVAVSVAQP